MTRNTASKKMVLGDPSRALTSEEIVTP